MLLTLYQPISLLTYAVTSLVIVSTWLWTSEKKSHPRPPGPRPIPLLGNVHQLPLERQQYTFKKWGETFGELVYARLFLKDALILNSFRVAQDLLQDKGALCSGRPRSVLLNEILGYDFDFGFMQYGDRWRKQRKMAHIAFQTNDRLLSYRAIQRREAYTLIAELYENPSLHEQHISKFAAAIIFDITYGYRITSCDDEYYVLTGRAIRGTVETGSPAATLVDFFPFLQYLPSWFPGSGSNKKALQVRKLVQDTVDRPYDECKRAITSGEASASWVASMLAEHTKDGVVSEVDEDDIKGVAMACNIAGAETTATVLLAFLLAIVIHPEVFAKAQREMDKVVGEGRLPDYDDRDSLPYLECIIKELYRWNPPAPLGLPHATTEEVEYRGYRIPTGTMLFQNIWGMMQDEESYPQPERFFPERFEKMDEHEARMKDTRRIVFGFGRRACPGRHLADSSVWLAAAMMIATLDIGKARDASGKLITPEPTFVQNFVSRPAEFLCRIQPRAETTRQLIHQMLA
ncbi:cytochrome P450 [Laetiporus sulphureus 93-53]|uniref:Cytochrome P450 n=1 Tax=Laetiporus sulphureus 93-53 TaxID=1314785 RepID=A0A165D4B5_9APHY|nr:cytochrome P450 [Laetiporus sulphureus 93-53]KZT04130.1 cytochrome P450 [Laetiporus sulphureus 93-53]